MAPQNLVQMLAREEGAYSRYNGYDWRTESSTADKEDTGELAGIRSCASWGAQGR